MRRKVAGQKMGGNLGEWNLAGGRRLERGGEVSATCY